MFDRLEIGNDCVVVNIEIPGQDKHPGEFEELVKSTGAKIVDIIDVKISKPHPRYFFGVGKAEEIAAAVAEAKADLVIVDHSLAPSQERNLEGLVKSRVLDRSGLILDIFAQRAQSFEGKLQVELAQLAHLSTRLVRGWTHLERQKGGIGLRGPGETQLETDRRLIGARIKQIQKRLEKVDSRREQGRRNRKKNELPTVSLVGYTNAGKSTLFNRLTQSKVYSADQLFATLDPTIRKLDLGAGEHALIVDTVGFISNLPHELIDSFKSTLQETREATVLLHVIDASDPARQERRRQVEEVLGEIGAEVPQILVYNKVDMLDSTERDNLLDAMLGENSIAVSAETGEGIDDLLHKVAENVRPLRRMGWLTLSAQHGRERAMLYDRDAVKHERIGETGEYILQLEIAEHDWQRFIKHTGLKAELVNHPG